MSLEIDLNLEYRRFRLDVRLNLPETGISVISGDSGSGKSTLLRAIAGLEPGVRGRIRLGDSIWQDDRLNRPAHQRPVGMVFQGAGLLPHLSVAGNLRFARKRAINPPLPWQAIVNYCGLETLLDHRPDQLSGGQKQRVALARALNTDARLLLLDEPLTGLDQTSRQGFLDLLIRLAPVLPGPIIYVTHHLDEVGYLADHVVTISAGQVSSQGTALEQLTRPDRPLAQHPGSLTPISVTIERHDIEDGLTLGRWGNSPFWLAGIHGQPGHPRRVLLHARDITLAARAPEGTSMLNAIAVRVEEWCETEDGQSLVRLQAPDGPLLARLTRRSVRHLGLHPGQSLIALFKAVAVTSMAEITDRETL